MPKTLEFTTFHGELTYGNPIYELERLKRRTKVTGVKVDGKEVEFADSTIPERLGRYILNGPKLRRRQIANDCVAFVAVMNSVELVDKHHNPYRVFDTAVQVASKEQELENALPLVLVQGFHEGVRIPRHIVLPAHTTEPNYLHKLGDRGPLCMSSLEDALEIFECTSAHPATPA